MPVKSLPPNPSLEHLKYQARDLQNALSQGNAEALARVRESHPKFARMSDDEIRDAKLSLADAQLIIAREYGFQSWPKLKQHIEVLARAPGSIAGSQSSSKPPAGPVELKEKWPAGARVVRETELKQTAEVYIPGIRSVKSELSLTTQHACTVVKELPSGGREVELEHLSFRLDINSRGWFCRYDSTRSSPADHPEVAKVFNTLLRAKVRYFLDANNHLERVDGVDKLMNRLNFLWGAKLKPGMTWDNQALDKVLTRMRPGEGLRMESIATGLKSMFNEDYFNNKLDRAHFPGKAVQPGDTWTFSRESRRNKWNVFLSLNIMREGTVTFTSWEMRGDRLCARLDFHGTQQMKTIRQERSEAPKPFLPMLMGSFAGTTGFLLTEGTFSGVVWFAPELGRGIEMNVNHDFKVLSHKMAIPPPYAKPGGQAAPDRYHQVITEKVVSEGS